MLSLLRPNLALSLVVCLFMAATHIAVYQRGANTERLACANARLQSEEQTAAALAQLARQYAQADATASEQRAEARRLAREVGRLRDAALKDIPDSSCTLDADESAVLHNAYCARFPNAPGCSMR